MTITPRHRVQWQNVLNGVIKLSNPRHRALTNCSAAETAYLVRAHRWLSSRHDPQSLRVTPLDQLLDSYQEATSDQLPV